MLKTDYQPPQSQVELLNRYANGERHFPETDLDQAVLDLQGAHLAGISFNPSSFLVADFRNANLQGADFSNCNIKTCDFRGANLQEARFCHALLESTEFAGAQLEGTDFTDASCFSKVFDAGEKPDW